MWPLKMVFPRVTTISDGSSNSGSMCSCMWVYTCMSVWLFITHKLEERVVHACWPRETNVFVITAFVRIKFFTCSRLQSGWELNVNIWKWSEYLNWTYRELWFCLLLFFPFLLHFQGLGRRIIYMKTVPIVCTHP